MKTALAVRDLLGDYRPANSDEILSAAKEVISHRFRRGVCITAPLMSIDLFQQKLVLREQEVFAALFLDNKNRVIIYEELFYGTIDSASVYPRIVAQKALQYNAAAVIVAHNHPSGVAEPSRGDESITLRLKEALALVEVQLLDHIVVGDGKCVSLAERGVI